jgi:hypothetical protein
VKRALWEAVRTWEESASMSRGIAKNNEILRKRLLDKASERERHANVIRDLLLTSTGNPA